MRVSLLNTVSDAEGIKKRNYWDDEFGEDVKKLVSALKACSDPAG